MKGDVQGSLDKSLKELGTDYVDLLLMHVRPHLPFILPPSIPSCFFPSPPPPTFKQDC
jgi:hypothetical protein